MPYAALSGFVERSSSDRDLVHRFSNGEVVHRLDPIGGWCSRGWAIVADMERLLRAVSNTPGIQAAILTRAQVIKAGYDDKEIRRLIRRGVWRRLRRGVYLPRAVWLALDDVGRHRLEICAALWTVRKPTVLSHVSAAVAHGLDLHEPDLSLVHVTRPALSSPRTEAGICHHTGRLGDDCVQDIDGVTVTSVARTVIDVARTSSFEAGVVLADSALRSGSTRDDLQAQLHACADWSGARLARRVVSFADGGAESVGESLARLAFAEQGLPPPELQVELYQPSGTLCARTDFAFLDHWTVAEFDGKRKYYRDLADHEDPGEIVWREKRREDEIRERFGFEVVRVTWSDVLPRNRASLAGRMRAAFSRAAERRSLLSRHQDFGGRVVLRSRDAA